MKIVLRTVVVSVIGLGAMALLGCQPNHSQTQTSSADAQSGFAGGTGAFGEDPVSPGAYRTSHAPLAPAVAHSNAEPAVAGR